MHSCVCLLETGEAYGCVVNVQVVEAWQGLFVGARLVAAGTRGAVSRRPGADAIQQPAYFGCAISIKHLGQIICSRSSIASPYGQWLRGHIRPQYSVAYWPYSPSICVFQANQDLVN